MLDFSKIEAGQLKLALADYSMKDVVYNVFSAVEPLAAKKNLDFKVDVPPDMPAGHGDERKLTQVLLNLVGNAIKFTDAGEVAIKVAPANGSFSVAVHDTGPGISAADQEKLFEEFQQADNSITKAKGGTGLGLAISRRIIEMHGGRIWVDSSPGNGSVFTFDDSRPWSSTGEPVMSKRILLVEDEEDNMQILRDLLAAGYEIDRGRERREGAGGGGQAAAGPHPDGHPASDHGRLRGDAPHQGRPGAAIDPDHRDHVLCAGRR